MTDPVAAYILGFLTTGFVASLIVNGWILYRFKKIQSQFNQILVVLHDRLVRVEAVQQVGGKQMDAPTISNHSDGHYV